MHISVSIVDSTAQVDRDICSFDVFPDMTLADIKALVESETAIPSDKQHLFLNQQPLADNTKSLQHFNVQENDVLLLIVRDPGQITQQTKQDRQLPSPRQATSGKQRQPSNAEMIRLQALSTPAVMQQMRQGYPELADSVNDPGKFNKLWDEMQRRIADTEAQKHARLAYINANPFDAEAQKEIEEMIQEERVRDNLEKALENHPEVFGRVNMLYIEVTVNKQPVKAFVDSGAQTTIMSPACAERCNIRHLIDRRYAGIARGVGTARILGRVHSADIEIGSYSLPCSFTVMEGKDVDLLLGLDMLKRHQMCIDLQKEVLQVGSEEVRFLGEAEIPKYDYENEPTVDGPDGIKVGTKTGALHTDGATTSEAQPSSSSIKNASPGAAGQKKADLEKAANGLPKINIRPAQKATSSATSQQSSIQPTPQPQQVAATASVPPELVNRIVEMGFTRPQALAALQRAEGNLDLALSLLMYGE